MSAVVHVAPQTPLVAPMVNCAPAHADVTTPSPHKRPCCPECGVEFTRDANQPRQIFCSAEHRTGFQERMRFRGRAIAPLAMAARITRGGSRGDKTTGRRARSDADALIRKWELEDREAGRMSAVEYMALRYKHGFELP